MQPQQQQRIRPLGVQVRCAWEPEALVVSITGEAGFRDAARLDEQLRNVANRRPDLVVLDLSGLTFISSLGISALLNFKRAVERRGGFVTLSAAAPAVLGLLRRARLDTVFAVRHETAAAAR